MGKSKGGTTFSKVAKKQLVNRASGIAAVHPPGELSNFHATLLPLKRNPDRPYHNQVPQTRKIAGRLQRIQTFAVRQQGF